MPSSKLPARTLAYILFMLFAVALGVKVIADRQEEERDIRHVEVYMHVRDLIGKNYVEDVGDEKLFYGSIRGMLDTLDPHSTFLTPDDFREMNVETHGEFGGLGIEINIEEDWLTVITPLLGTPAYEAGVLAGDRIVRIEGDSTKGLSLLETVKRLRGKPNTQVTITVIHRHDMRPVDITITRAKIEIESVRFGQMLDPEHKIGYVKLVNFQDDTTRRMREELKALDKQGVKGLIIDLRANPGGLLSQAIGVSDLFVRDGVIVSTRGRPAQLGALRRSDDAVYRAHKRGTHADVPLVVLIDGSSASASEIVAAALHDHGRAALIGAKSYGKGSVQTVIPLNLGRRKEGAVKLTTAKYYTPNDVSIHGIGITPDIVVEMSAQQIRAVIQQQRAEWIRRNSGRDSAKPALEEKPKEEKQAARTVDLQRRKALEYLRSYLSEGPEAAKAFIAAEKAKRDDRLAKAKTVKEEGSEVPVGKPKPFPPEVMPTD